MNRWLALMIGNSRLHWADCERLPHLENRPSENFQNTEAASETPQTKVRIRQTWDIQHLPATAKVSSELRLPPELSAILSGPSPIPLLMASVVPAQTRHWQATYPSSRVLTLANVPLANLYPTLGIDRALALLGAWYEWKTSALVIDGGTALTLTGVDSGGTLIGGAILPGLGLQMRSLHQQTAALPSVKLEASALDTPQALARWQTNTPDAIRSGIWHGAIAAVQSFINDWLAQYPTSAIIFTGGDGKELCEAIAQNLSTQNAQGITTANPPLPPALMPSAFNIVYDPQIIFKGIAFIQSTKHYPASHSKPTKP